MSFSISEIKDLISYCKSNDIDEIKVQGVEIKFSKSSSLYKEGVHIPLKGELQYAKQTSMNSMPSDEELLMGSAD